jgi:nucleoid-associated protein YgaU
MINLFKTIKILNLKDTKMNQGRLLRSTTVLLTAVSVVILLTAGCDSSKKIETLQKDNQTLTQRVAELEGQLKQTEAAVIQSRAAQAPPVAPQTVQVKDTFPTAAPTPAVQPEAAQSVYVVVEGDNLWKIAKKQLGNGARYKEILSLNPNISKDKPLVVGEKLTLPAR